MRTVVATEPTQELQLMFSERISGAQHYVKLLLTLSHLLLATTL